MTNTFAGIPTMTPNEQQDDYGRWLIHGPQGSGKSTLASTIANLGRTLFIDTVGEKGTRSFKGAPYASNIEVIRPTSITQFDDIFWALDKGGHPYKAVVVDSLTGIQKMTMRYLLGHDETAVREIRQGTAPADIRTWGQSLDVMVDTATFWYGLADGNREHPMHVVMTAQTKVQENEESASVERTPDVQKGALSITLAAPDYIVYTDVEENLDAMSDESLPPMQHIVRFGAHPGYRTKARIPVPLRGRMPSVLGRKSPPDLAKLSTVLGIGGAPKPAPKTSAKAEPAAPATAAAASTTNAKK